MVRTTLIYLLVMAFMVSCQSLGNLNSSSNRFKKRIDDASPRDIIAHTQKILVSKYQYELARTNESPSSIYIETMWKVVNPTSDEQAKGIKNTRVRFKIVSRETRSGISNSQLHNLTFSSEVETSAGSEHGWTSEILTPERRDYLEQVYFDFETEFRSGVINF